MPPFQYLGQGEVGALVNYVQSLGFKDADYRVKRQQYWKQKATEAYEAGPDGNVTWLHEKVPEPWRKLRSLPNDYRWVTARSSYLPKFLHWLPRAYWGRNGSGLSFYLSATLNFTVLKGREYPEEFSTIRL